MKAVADAIVLAPLATGQDLRGSRLALEAHAESLGGSLDTIYLCGSCEAHLLGVAAGRSLLEQLARRFPAARLRLVHLACLSFIAAVADFVASDARRAIVICDESSTALSQQYLSLAANSATRGDELTAVAGIGVVDLRRCGTPRPRDICVTDLRLFARPQGLQGTRDLLAKMRRAYDGFRASGTDLVSMWIQSSWCEALMLDLRLGGGANKLLASAESDKRHLMSLKPLREIELHAERISARPIALTTLGFGGRVGMMRLSAVDNASVLAGDAHLQAVERPLPETFPPARACGYPELLVAADSLAPGFRGQDGLYFASDIPRARVAPSRQPARRIFPGTDLPEVIDAA